MKDDFREKIFTIYTFIFLFTKLTFTFAIEGKLTQNYLLK